MLLTDHEREFLAAFIHEATTDPFNGPATDDLHRHGIYYEDLSHLLAAYGHENPHDQVGFAGKYSTAPPSCPWRDHAEAIRRDHEVETEFEKHHAVSP